MVYISYQREKQQSVLEFKKVLESNNLICWMAINGMLTGDDLLKEIDKRIRGCQVSSWIPVFNVKSVKFQMNRGFFHISYLN